MKNLKYILYVVCGLLAFAPALTSCQDKPMEDPAEEIFLREFIKKYGLIDPNQDWNQAERTSVTVNVDKAKEINVYVKYFNRYYRVACFVDVEGEVTIPVDVPEATDMLYVSVDGKIYTTTLGGKVDTTPKIHKIPSRALSSSTPRGKCLCLTTGTADNFWENCLEVKFANFTIQHGDQISISYEVRSSDGSSVVIDRMSINDSGGNIQFLNDPTTINGNWTLHTISATANYSESDQSKAATQFAIYFGTEPGKTYYFDNISIYVKKAEGNFVMGENPLKTTIVNFNSSDYNENNLGAVVAGKKGSNDGSHSITIAPGESSTLTRDDTGIVRPLWYVEGVGGKAQITDFTNNIIENVNFKEKFYQPNPSESVRYYNNDPDDYQNEYPMTETPDVIYKGIRDLNGTPHVTSATNTQMVMNDVNPFAYAQIFIPEAQNQYLKISFDVAVTSGAEAYFYPMDAPFGDKPGGLINETKRYNFVTTSAITGMSWPKLAFKAISGDVTISNMTIELSDTPEFISAGDMTWLMVAEDLGATDDFDFNDVIVQVKALASNTAKMTIKNEQWQVIQDDKTHLVLGAPSKAASRDMVYTHLYIKPLCAGGILDSYLHFSTGIKDFVLKPSNTPWDLTGSASDALLVSAGNHEASEWHSWFVGGPYGTTPNEREMLNTGYSSYGNNVTLIKGKPCSIIVSGEFSLTNYSKIFKDYDGKTDQIGTTTGSGDDIHYGYQEDDQSDPTQLDSWHYAADGTYRIHGFYISVGNADYTEAEYLLGQPKKGRAPQMFLIPDVADTEGGLWRWPHERVDIVDVYPQFKDWVNSNANPQWYMQEPTAQAQTKEGKKSGDYEWVKAYIDR